MNTGPAVRGGHDLALTELIDAAGHRFLVEAGSDVGAELLAALPGTPASEADIAAARAQTERTAAAQTRRRAASMPPRCQRY